MIVYYSDGQGNYFTDQNGNLYSNEINILEALTKKYKPVIYKNGKFQRVIPYVGSFGVLSASFITNEDLQFMTADGSYLMTAESSTQTDIKFAFRKAFSCIFGTEINIENLLIDNSGNILVNNDNYYLIK